MKNVTVIDYGIGNLLSVRRAFEYCNAKVFFTSNPNEVINADRLVLPGVGAFADAMKGLKERNLIEAIQSYTTLERPFLGICLGMQMMLSESEEFGRHEGLNFIPGKVVKIPSINAYGQPCKIPHIGWNQLVFPPLQYENMWNASLLEGLSEKSSAYFVHSFTALPDDNKYRWADVVYGGNRFSAVIRKDNLYGCQFHPEKSGPVGLKIVSNFLSL